MNPFGAVVLWDVTTGKEVQRREIGAQLASVAVAPDGRDALIERSFRFDPR